ncbi:MAG TPA: Na+/H+ antiporter subunit D [Acidimicrobiia bacterium]
MTWLVPLPVVIPLAGAGLAVALGRRSQLQRIVSVVSLTSILAASLGLLFTVNDSPLVVQVADWPAPIGISLVADRLSALMLVISSAVTFCVLLFALAQDLALGDPDSPVAIFHPTYLVLTAGVSISFLAGDLFNLYVGFEVLLGASYVLITLGGTRARIRAGTIYVVMAIASSIVFLLAVALIYSATGTVNMAQLAGRLQEIDPGIKLTLQVLLLAAFAVKAAIFPLSAWLPDSYPTAPAPVTAVFAGLLTKVGIYGMLRTQTLLFGEGPADTVLMWAALATMIIGILGAVAQTDLKRLLSFTLVSHIGLMVFGIALSSEAGLAGAIFYVLHHITVQTSLFLVAGLIERREGTTSLNRLGGLARSAPLLAALFLVPAFNLSGIPPLSGFLGKLGLLQAGVEAATPLAYVLVGGSILTSLLTLYVFAKAWNKAFWQPPIDPTQGTRLPAGMLGTAAALVVLGLALTFAAGPLFDYATEAARDMYARTPYIEAILGSTP